MSLLEEGMRSELKAAVNFLDCLQKALPVIRANMSKSDMQELRKVQEFRLIKKSLKEYVDENCTRKTLLLWSFK